MLKNVVVVSDCSGSKNADISKGSLHGGRIILTSMHEERRKTKKRDLEQDNIPTHVSLDGRYSSGGSGSSVRD